MKRNPYIRPSAGFTLVELLVVIVIIGALASLTFTVGPKMMKRSQAAKNIVTMRQVGVISATYSADRSNELIPIRTDVQDANGNWSIGMDWTIALLALAYPDATVTQIKDRNWWKDNKPFMYNPLIVNNMKTGKFSPGKNGYSMNAMLSYKLNEPRDTWGQPGESGAQSKGVNISKIPRPSRTVLFSTAHDYHFNNNVFKDPRTTPMIVDGKVTMMFVDGHIESVDVKKYMEVGTNRTYFGNDTYDYTGF